MQFQPANPQSNRLRYWYSAVLCAAMVLGLTLSAAGQAPQAPNNWINPAGGNYNDGPNWALGAPGGLPGPYPIFNLGAAGYPIQMTLGEGAVDPTVQTDNPTINLNNQTYVTRSRFKTAST